MTLRNRDIPDGVTLHWHGLSVPSGGDGVAGVTQDAVFPGETFVYRFRAERPGPSGTTPTSTAPFALSGAAFRVLALDGGRPERTDRAERPSGASSRGGRYDLAFAIAGQPGPAATPKATSAPRRTGPRSRCRPWRGEYDRSTTIVLDRLSRLVKGRPLSPRP